MAIPRHSPYVIVGAGIHGLSTAYHLALRLKASRKGEGRDIVILDKSGICSGATGIACFRRQTIHSTHGCAHAPLSSVVPVAPAKEHHARGGLT